MSLAGHFQDLPPSWAGQSRLHLSWNEEGNRIFTSDSNLHISLDPLGTYAMVDYTWMHDGESHTGHLFFALKAEAEATGAWMDSWHQSGGILQLRGPADPSLVSLTGSYGAGEGPDWGWRIELELISAGILQLRMTNITPEGEEEWAVEGNYQPA